MVFGAEKNNQRDVFNHADEFFRLVLLFNRRKRIFGVICGKYRSSTVAARNFLHNRGVDILFYAV